MLAHRTKNLIEELKPDTVFLQTNQRFLDLSRALKDVNCQEDLQKYENKLLSIYDDSVIPHNIRGWIFRARLYPFLLFLQAKHCFYSLKKVIRQISDHLHLELK